MEFRKVDIWIWTWWKWWVWPFVNTSNLLLHVITAGNWVNDPLTRVLAPLTRWWEVTTTWCTPLSPLTVNHTIVPNDLSPLLVTWGVRCLANNVLRAIANSCVLREIVCLLSNVFNQSMGDGFDSSILCDGKPDVECYGSWQIPGGQCVILPAYRSYLLFWRSRNV